MQKIYIWGLLQFFTLLCFSQSSVISGIVKDERGISLPGVTIQEKDTQRGTVSDLQGQFRISTSPVTKLLVSAVGFDDQIILVNNQSFLNITMIEAVSELEELVITALGIERQTKDLGYPVQRLEANELSGVKAANFVDNLAGKLAGVTVSQGATGVGSTSKITIRGEASFTNNNPLFVVDGIPINNNTIVNFTNDAAAGFQEVDFGNGAMEVNPDDIASVSVLKGPGAAALYGTRASNGVVLITTKDGSETSGMGISFNSTTYIERAFQLPRFQNEYGQGNSGQFAFVDGLGGGTNDNISYSWGPRLDQGSLIAQFDSPVTLADGSQVRGGDVAVHGGLPIIPSAFVSYPDNLKDFYRTGVTAINNLSIGSAFEKGNYRLSFTDLSSQSIIPGVNLDRRTLAARLTFRPISKIKVATSVSYVNAQSDNRPSNGYGSENVNYSLVAWGPRSLNINQLKDYWQPGLEDIQQYSFNYTFFDNPYFILRENRNSFNRDRVFGNISATYAFSDELSFTIRSGMDYSSEERQFRRAFSTNRFQNGGYAVHDVFFRENNTDFLLNYSTILGAFDLDISIGGNQMDQRASTVQTQALSLAQPGIFSLSNSASPLEVFEFLSQKRINSLYGLLKVGYDDFAYVEVTARNDWSSALASPNSNENTSFFYPSVATSLIVSNIVELPASISFLKVRGSLAQVGNDTNPYQTAGVFNARTPYEGQPTFSAQSTIPNSNLLPEKTTAIEIGGEVRLFQDRVRLDMTYYNALTKNQIISLPISITSGYTERVVNGGEVRSEGIEVMAGITPIKGRLTWNAQFNFSRNITTIESLPDEVDRLTLAYSRIYDNVNQTVFFQVDEGGRVGDMYGTGYLRNENGDFVIGNNGLYVPDNRLQKLGNYNPDFILGLSNQLSYKNWTLGFLLDWRQGGVLVSRTLALAAVGGQLEETASRPEEGIVAEGVVNMGTSDSPDFQPNTQAVSAESYYRNFYDRNHEENNTYDASYLKLRELSLGYTITQGLPLGLQKLKIALVGRNLLAISEIPHFDPEQLAVQGQQFVSGVEDMSYASSRSFGVKVGIDL
ncbi:MAG: SusC/RagA family TonB-linked outer membrane protein [Cyclobacteriaceae bacterium]|nr:SusC/RagA family TonB-linked outer membrane protein [Cyclobacteriaceae bacterium HetDA_MAG_MS6]